MRSCSTSKPNLMPWFLLIYCLSHTDGLKVDDSVVGGIDSGNSSQNYLEEEPVFYQGVYGKPGVDFPVLSHIPKTTFSCREMEAGYYADLETDCQVFHICEEGKKISFLCPNGTIFQQSELICEWWFKVNCTNSPNLYLESAEQLREDNARRKASRRVYSNGDNHGAIMRTEQQSSVRASQKGRNFEIVSSSTFKQNQQFSSETTQRGQKTRNFESQPTPLTRNSQQLSSETRQNGQKTPTFGSQPTPLTRSGQQFSSETSQKAQKTPNFESQPTPFTRNTQQLSSETQKGQKTPNFESQPTPFTRNSQQLSSETIQKGQKTPTFGSQPTPLSRSGQLFSSETSQKGQKTPNFESQPTPFTRNSQQLSSETQNGQKTPNFESQPTPFTRNSQQLSSETIQKGQKTPTFGSQPTPLSRSGQLFSSETSQKGQETPNFESQPTPFTRNSQQLSSETQKGQKTPNFENPPTPLTRNSQQFSRKFDQTAGNNQKEIELQRESILGESPEYVNIRINGKTSQPGQNQFVNNKANSITTPRKEQNQNIRLTVSTRLGGSQIPTTTPQENRNLFIANKLGEDIVDKSSQNAGTFSTGDKRQESNGASTNRIAFERKDATSKQSLATNKQGVPANDPSESEESQIPQETASFYKNGINSIQQSYKPTVHPNHRETYSDIKEPQYYSNKIFSAISSVTPQYLTTQPINNGRPFIGSQVGTNLNAKGSTTPSIVASTEKTPPSITPNALSTPTGSILLDLEAPVVNSFNAERNKVISGTTVAPIENNTKKTIDYATVYGKFVNSVTPTVPTIYTASSLGTTAKILHSKPAYGSYTATSSPQSFSVTKNSSFTSDSYSSVSTFGYTTSTTPTPLPDQNGNFKFTNDLQRPRPFKLSTSGASYLPKVTTQMTQKSTIAPTYPTYRVSSASPFSKTTPENDVVSTTQSTLPSTFENIDSMIRALAEMAQKKERFGETARPGLVVPPSAGPQTLHTLAVYFANALDGLDEDKEGTVDGGDEDDREDDDLTQTEIEKKRLTALLTQMTMERYNELFNDNKEDIAESTTLLSSDDDSDLEGAHTKSATPNPNVRQLAKVFTQALSSYLDDPVTFRKVLAEVRPTEPPSGETEETPSEIEDELLNFSDADVKSSFPPVFPTRPTPPAAKPTWGYLIAYNTTNNFDSGRNSLNPEQENLQLADSQSFVSQFNQLTVDEKHQETTTASSSLPNNHWTRSPDATKLWKTAFTFNPAVINENLETTTQSIIATTLANPESEEDTDVGTLPASLSPPLDGPHHEIKYELRALPSLALNSTQVHGILIDFMNNTKSHDDNRLQRILRKLNTTEDEFLKKMKEIETNPLTRRLILLLISECGENATKEIEAQAVPIHDLISRNLPNHHEILVTASTNGGVQNEPTSHVKNSNLEKIVDPNLHEESEDARALQLLNSLYTIASRFGK